jgi:hypothetical protein
MDRKEYLQKYYQDHKQQYKDTHARYVEKNRDKINKEKSEDYYNNQDERIQKQRERNSKCPEKPLARNIVNHAIRRGELIRQPCAICGNEFGNAHHEDYSKPFEIIWLCRSCHMKLHARKKLPHLGY